VNARARACGKTIAALAGAACLAALTCVGARAGTRIDPARVHLPAAPAIPEDNSLVLAGPGVRAAILIGDEQPPYRFPYWGGHAILARFLEAITGQAVPVLTASQHEEARKREPYHARIWVGDQPKVREAIGAELAKLDDDGFVIRCIGRDLYVSGKHTWGTHFAAYDLLERFAGCRWYAPGPRFWQPKEDGVVGLLHVVPRAPSVRVPADTHLVEEPSYRMRWMRHMPRHEFRMRYRDRFHHNLSTILPPAAYGETHPEYFPEIDGKRRVPAKGREHDFQPCISNPEVVELVAGAAEKHFEEHPDEGSFSLGMNDSNRFCECARCQAIPPPGLPDKDARIAWAFFRFYNQVAERVARKHPDKRLGCLAYSRLSLLPAGSIQLHPMIVPYLTRDSAQLFDPNEVAEFRQTVDRWSKLASRMGIYEYVYGLGFVVPRIYNRYLLRNIKERYGVGVDGFYAEDYPNWGLDGPKYWLIAKLLWNHRLDPEELKNDYFTKLFGPVAREMHDYFETLEEAWCTQTLKSPRSNYRWFHDPQQLAIFPPAKCDEAWAMLEAAEGTIRDYLAVVRDEKKGYCERIAQRVRFFKTSFALTRALCTRHDVASRLGALAAQDRYPFAEAMAHLDRAFEPGAIRREFDRMTALPFSGLAPIYPIDYATLVQRFASHPGINTMIHRLVEDTMTEALAKGVRSPEDLGAAVDDVLTRHAASATGFKSHRALARVAEIAKTTGALLVRAVAQPPSVDGRIDAREWGEPAYRGHFFQAFTLEPARHRTTVWAAEHGGKLYLAFDCEGDPQAIGASVEGSDTDLPYPARMANDDAISVCLKRERAGLQRIRVNVNGSVQDDGPADWDVCEARVSHTPKGWQAELALDIERTNASRAAVAEAPTWACISRYEREQAGDGNAPPSAVCTTLAPVADIGGHVGHGNHPHLMAFVWGPRVVYPRQPATRP